MIWLVVGCSLGLPAGFLLLWRVPLRLATVAKLNQPVSIISPARNEEQNLPRLIQSIGAPVPTLAEIVVVDDASTDQTSAIAQSMGATVVAPGLLPSGWTGKTWACSQGANAASADRFLFLDADTYFAPHGFESISAFDNKIGGIETAISVLPYHVMHNAYEQLSLVFNLLMAFGAGGFGAFGHAKLFGQSLLISRQLYVRSGGHEAVRNAILENLLFSSNIRASGGKCVCLGGRGILNIRMFPHGFSQLREGWSKAFADGAAASETPVLLASIVWLTALCATFLSLLFAPWYWHWVFAVVYICFVLQIAWLARQIGNYQWLTFLFYPLPLIFFFAIFSESLYRRIFKRKVTWRGRSL